MRILISGGNGYVGRELCRLLADDHEICVMDSLRYGAMRLESDLLAKLRFEEIDIRQLDKVTACIKGFSPDVIIHLAAVHFIPECENQPDLAVSTNVSGTVNLLAACPQDCRFVFASSGAVYQPEDGPHLEDKSPLRPSDVYGLTKLQGEMYTRYFAKKRGFPGVIVRLFNVIGPGETNPHVMPEIVAQLKAGRTTLQLGNLSPKRDFISVWDAASGFTAVSLNGKIASGTVETVNLGTQYACSVSHLLQLLRQISDVPFEVITDPARLRKVDRPFLAADRTKIKRLFEWEPQISLESTIERMWAAPDLPDALVAKYKGGIRY